MAVGAFIVAISLEILKSCKYHYDTLRVESANLAGWRIDEKGFYIISLKEG